jgi:hypothetical protein
MEKTWVQNFYTPINPDKYIGDLKEIVYRSSWERHFFQYCDTTSNILKWSSEPFAIKYWDQTTAKTRRYFPDVYAEIKDSNGLVKKYLIEIKPYKQTIPPKEGKKKTKTYLTECRVYLKNESKWKFAREFCEQNGLEFLLITENELGLNKK